MTTRPRDHVVPPDLPKTVEVVAAWVDAHHQIWRACIIGSRVRGDHRPDSDLDVVVQPPPGGMDDDCLRWWLPLRQSEHAVAQRFASFREAVHPLALHLSHAPHDPAQGWANRAALNTDNVVIRLRRVVCLWTFPRIAKTRDDATT